MDERQLLKRLEALQEQVSKMAKPAPSAGNGPKVVFGGYGPGASQQAWPHEQLVRLSKAYGSEQMGHFMAKDGRGKPRGIGWGPALVKMAGICQPSLASNSNYGQEHLEKEFGFTTVTKAASEGIKGLNGEVRKVALAEGAGGQGGYLIPPQFLTELLTIAAEDAFMEPRCRVIPMNSRTLTIPSLDITTAPSTGTSPYFGGILATWQPEAATISETEPVFRQTELTAWDLVLYTVSSNQLLQDNGVGLDALLTQLFASAITWYKEYAYLSGNGAGALMPLGIVNAAASYTQNRTTNSRFLFPDVAAMLQRLHVRSWDSAVWMMHPSLIVELIKMTNNATNSPTLVWLNPMGQGIEGPIAGKLPRATLAGLPIFFTEKLPSLGGLGDVILADLQHYVVGNRLDYQIDVSKDYLFRTNQLAWRVVARSDGRPWLNGTITDANGFVSSPFVVLNNN